MIAVASGTSGRAQVAAVDHRLVVHALRITGELVGRNLVGLHVLRIGMAAGACGCDVQGVNFGALVVSRAQVMHTVAIRANGNLRIA